MENELPKRKLLRWRGFDYNRHGTYFVTFCTHERKNTLSHIVGAIHESPAPELTEYGNLVEKFIKETEKRFGVSVDRYVIMPNHVHLVLVVEASEECPSIPPIQARSLLSKIIGYIKANTAKEIHKRDEGVVIWQRGFYDRVVRNREEYNEIIKYIRENPLCWQMGIAEDW